MATPPFGKIFGGNVLTVPGNTCAKFEVERRNFLSILVSYRDPHFGLFGFWGYLATSSAKSDVGFLLGNPDFLLGRRNFVPIVLSYRNPHFGLPVFGFLGFLGIYLLPVQNRTSYDTQ